MCVEMRRYAGRPVLVGARRLAQDHELSLAAQARRTLDVLTLLDRIRHDQLTNLCISLHSLDILRRCQHGWRRRREATRAHTPGDARLARRQAQLRESV